MSFIDRGHLEKYTLTFVYGWLLQSWLFELSRTICTKSKALKRVTKRKIRSRWWCGLWYWTMELRLESWEALSDLGSPVGTRSGGWFNWPVTETLGPFVHHCCHHFWSFSLVPKLHKCPQKELGTIMVFIDRLCHQGSLIKGGWDVLLFCSSVCATIPRVDVRLNRGLTAVWRQTHCSALQVDFRKCLTDRLSNFAQYY